MNPAHGNWNLNWQLADTPYFVVEYDSGFVVKSLDGMGTMLPVRMVENNTYNYYCLENESIYTQGDINKFFYSDQCSILPVEVDISLQSTPNPYSDVLMANEFMEEGLAEEYDIMDMLV